jgi:probable blue pigment (indigoidine) exporter
MKRSTAGVTVLAPLAWGTTYVTITEFLPPGRPLLVAAMRVGPAAAVLLVAGRMSGRWRPHGAEWWRTAALAACNFGVFFPLLAIAVYRLPGGVAAAVGGLQPLMVTTGSAILARSRPRRLELVVGAVAAGGVALVAVRPGAAFDPVGLLAAVGANVSFATGVVLTKRFPPATNRIAATGWQLLLGSAALLPITFLVEGPPPAFTGRNLVGFAYLGVVGTALAFLVWFNGIRRLPVSAPPLLGLAAPVTGATLGWVVLGQSLAPLQLVGFVVTLGAIAYGATVGSRRRGLLDLDGELGVGEAHGAVDADRHVVGVSHHHQGPGPELVGAVAGGMVHERAGEPLAAGVGVGLHHVVPGQPGGGHEQAE